MNDKNKKPIEVKDLQESLQHAVTHASTYLNQCADNYNTRYCLWAGQSPDGRKWEKELGKEPFPWEGAADTRIRLADMIVNENVAYMTSAFFRSRAQSMATESNDLLGSGLVTLLVQWLIRTQMDELETEVELLAQWQETFGASILGVFWKRETRMDYIEISVDQLQAAAQQMQAQGDPRSENFAQLLQMLNDPLQEEGLVDVMRVMGGDSSGTEAKRVIRELRTTGTSRLPRPYLVKNRPSWMALRLFKDFFCPVNTWDIQSAPWVAYREWLTPEDLKEKAASEDWDQAFIDEALKHEGKSSIDVENQLRFSMQTGRAYEERKGLIEIFHDYRKVLVDGIPVIYHTVYHQHVKDLMAFCEENPYRHGQYPFLPAARESIERQLVESRGVPDLVMTAQQEIKIQRDSRADRTSIATLPPAKVPPNRGDKQLVFGPAAQVVVKRNEDVEFMRPPAFDPGSQEIERATRLDAAEYFGRMTDNANPVLSQLYQQKRADRFLRVCTKALQMTFQLVQQFMSPQEVQRITGYPMPAWDNSIESIQGKFDFQLSFDVRDLDPEFVSQKIKLIRETILPLDRAGRVNTDRLLQRAFEFIDPNMSRDVLQDPQVVTDAETKDELDELSRMLNGIPSDLRGGNKNYQLRLKTLMQAIQQNPEIQQTLQQKPISKKLVEDRVQHFQFMLQQQQNAEIGRSLGVKPTLSLPGAGVGQ